MKRDQPMGKNVKIITDEDGKRLVVISRILFKGKRSICWDEVKEYYEAKAKALKAANTQANQELKDTDYFKLLKKRVNVARSLSIAQADESGEVEDLAAELKSVDESIEKILTEKKIDRAVLRKVPNCAVCNDTGLVRGEICLCALSNSKAIKSFAAANRNKKEQ